MSDLTDEELDWRAHGESINTNHGKALVSLVDEIRLNRAMVKRLEAWAESLESCPAGCMPPGDIAYELRDRMRTP